MNLLMVGFFIFSFLGCQKKQPKSHDLEFIYKTISNNHPGIYNVEDPWFPQNLQQFYDHAKKSLSKASLCIEQEKIIKDFCKSFNDPHLWVHWYSDLKKQNQNKKPANGLNKSFEIKQINDQVAWATISTFDINQDQQTKDFTLFLEEIQKIKNKQVIVFDLRGNQGGNSDYASRIIDVLFGKKFANQKRASAHKSMFVDWRASLDNTKHMYDFFKRYKDPWIGGIAKGMKQSLAQGEIYYREVCYQGQAEEDLQLLCSIAAKIIVVVDSKNVSAALDFIDELKIMKQDVILIGKTTKADRLYMEVRTIKLPSNLGTFSFPIKVYRNRPRGDDKPYTPDFECDIDGAKSIENFLKIIQCMDVKKV